MEPELKETTLFSVSGSPKADTAHGSQQKYLIKLQSHRLPHFLLYESLSSINNVCMETAALLLERSPLYDPLLWTLQHPGKHRSSFGRAESFWAFKVPCWTNVASEMALRRFEEVEFGLETSSRV